MGTSIQAWQKSRPIYDRLPENGYQDNDPSDWLTAGPDEYLSAKKNQLENFYLQLSPDTCANASLDYLAFLVGMSGEYWDVTWSSQVKRGFIREASRFLWPKRGTLAALRKVLAIHGLDYYIWQDSGLRFSFKMPGTFGTPRFRIFLQLDLKYNREGREFKEVERTARNWLPACLKQKVQYKKFYMGFSKLGDSMFA